MATCEQCRPLTCAAHADKLFKNVEKTRLDYFAAKKAMENAEEAMRAHKNVHGKRKTLMGTFMHQEMRDGRRACDAGCTALRTAFPKDTYEIIHGANAREECKVYKLYA